MDDHDWRLAHRSRPPELRDKAMNTATKNKFDNLLEESKHHFASGNLIGIKRSVAYLEEALRVAKIEAALQEVAP